MVFGFSELVKESRGVSGFWPVELKPGNVSCREEDGAGTRAGSPGHVWHSHRRKGCVYVSMGVGLDDETVRDGLDVVEVFNKVQCGLRCPGHAVFAALAKEIVHVLELSG